MFTNTVGGPEVQNDVLKMLQKINELNVSSVVSTKGHRLPCKHIIHVASPTWQDGRNNEENLLFEAVNNLLKEAVRLKAETIALPAIGAGAHGIPPDICAITMIVAICLYLTEMQNSEVRELRLVDQSVSVIEQWAQALQENGLFRTSK